MINYSNLNLITILYIWKKKNTGEFFIYWIRLFFSELNNSTYFCKLAKFSFNYKF